MTFAKHLLLVCFLCLCWRGGTGGRPSLCRFHSLFDPLAQWLEVFLGVLRVPSQLELRCRLPVQPSEGRLHLILAPAAGPA